MRAPETRRRMMGAAVAALIFVTPTAVAQEPDVPVLESPQLDVQEDNQETIQETEESVEDTEKVEESVDLSDMSESELVEHRQAVESQRRADSRARAEEDVQAAYKRLESIVESAPINPLPSFHEVSKVDYPNISPPINPLPRRIDVG